MITVDLSSPVHSDSAMSKALYRLYYGNSGLDKLIEMSGYPHNGGYHTCVIKGEIEDVKDWLEMFSETYYGINADIQWIKEQLKTSTRVSLKKYHASKL